MAHAFSGQYDGENLRRVAFPLGGIGAGMFCIEGTAALSHFSLHHRPDVYSEPGVFAAVGFKGHPEWARVLEGPVPRWKAYGPPKSANGAQGKTHGLPRFAEAEFTARFPFADVALTDPDLPVSVVVTAWSPFVPGDADNSSLPVAALEYNVRNTSSESVEAVVSFNTQNFMERKWGASTIRATEKGVVLEQPPIDDRPWEEGQFCLEIDAADAQVNAAWFRGAWFDGVTMAWKDVVEASCYTRETPATSKHQVRGATIFAPVKLEPGEAQTVRVLASWYVPRSNVCAGELGDGKPVEGVYSPWYASRFDDVDAVAGYWREHCQSLCDQSRRFSDCLFDTSLPVELVEAVAGNLSILKSPTVLRQADGRIWAWEGCFDNAGCCPGSCTHVWNYAQALPHLFPDLERSLRATEFGECQNEDGHQMFRASLPIQSVPPHFRAAADGQLGGVLKVYRDWRISGDTAWMQSLWPRVRQSLDYCIATWDPDRKGALLEPHHNTYDIEFWGADGMCTSFYLAALKAAVLMGAALDEDVAGYAALLADGRAYMESELFNGEYFIQNVQWEGLRAASPVADPEAHGYSPEDAEIAAVEGPKYQYGEGCLSDGVMGVWMAAVCGLDEVVDREKVRSHLDAVHAYNLREDLHRHHNPQRPSYAFGDDGGLLLCSWPRGEAPSLPFVYSNEVWTGIEYQVASHLIMLGLVEEGLEIVRYARARYDGCDRNPFDEYECGHWYARAMASYALLQAMLGARYDAVEKVLYLQPPVSGDFHGFLCTATGFGTVGVRNGEPYVDVRHGVIDIQRIAYEAAE